MSNVNASLLVAFFIGLYLNFELYVSKINTNFHSFFVIFRTAFCSVAKEILGLFGDYKGKSGTRFRESHAQCLDAILIMLFVRMQEISNNDWISMFPFQRNIFGILAFIPPIIKHLFIAPIPFV